MSQLASDAKISSAMAALGMTAPLPNLDDSQVLKAILVALGNVVPGGGGGGTGNVVGPASSINGDLAVFSGTTGKLLADGSTLTAKLNGIEAGADVTDATNVAAAGALMAADLGTGVETALGVNIGSAGSVLVTDYAADAGSTDSYVAMLNPAPAALVIGAHYRFMANTANTGAATINFNSLGAKTIVKAAGGITTALAINDIRAGQWVDVVYDGTNMQMQSTLGNAVSFDPNSAPTITFAAGGSLGVATGLLTLSKEGAGFGLASGTMRMGTTPLHFGTSFSATDAGISRIGVGVIRLNGGYSGGGILAITQVASASSVTDSALIYSKDVSGTAEMLVMNEAGNATQLTGTLIPSGLIRLKGYTVGTLPTGTQGDTAYVTDALTPVSLAAVVGGGSAVVKVFYDGTNWIVQ